VAQTLTEMKGVALAIVAMVALIGALAPFLNYFSGLQKLQFGNSAILNFLASFCTLGIFIVSFDGRHNLFWQLPFWVYFLLGIVLIAGLSTIVDMVQQGRTNGASTQQATWKWYESGIGGVIYVAAIGLMFFSLNKATAEMAYFQPVEGAVEKKPGEGRRLVRLVYANPGNYDEALTDRDGRFRFLVTPQEAKETSRLCVFKIDKAGARTPASTNDLILDYGCKGERGCRMEMFADQEKPLDCNKP
jgi:hypothetical protein